VLDAAVVALSSANRLLKNLPAYIFKAVPTP